MEKENWEFVSDTTDLKKREIFSMSLFFFSLQSLNYMLLIGNAVLSKPILFLKSQVTGVVLAHIVCKNPALKCLRVRGCRNLSQQKSNTGRGEISSSYSCGELEIGLSKTCRLEEISLGWGFSYFSMKALKPAITSLRAITMGLGASIGEDGLMQLPITCPTLESVVLYFQVLLVAESSFGWMNFAGDMLPCRCCY